MYQGDSPSVLVELTTAGSVSDIFNRVDAGQRISQQDAAIFEEARDLKARVAAQESKLRRSLNTAQLLARKLDRDSKTMASVVAERRQALATANADVRELMEQQRRAAAVLADVSSRSRADAIAAGMDPSTATTNAPTMSAGASQPVSGNSSTDSGVAAAAANIAMGKIGAPYVWAAAGPNSFDCSGLVVWAFAQAGRSGLPHSTYALIGMGIEVPMSAAQPGDLVFTNNTGHMGIYVGGGNMVHSPRTGRTVSVEPLTYYSVVAIRRI
ncbi:MAG: Cell wall-associated hydrolase, invasion-associated protein [Thermoleophilia bacterium]|nr:Cell wall-associated hydrolase, invasion-associated protein [Thermoleophilia bacterium]